MAYLIGTDEAGYGPNLGPLVISASVWQTPDDLRPEDLYDRLAGVIAPCPSEKKGTGSERSDVPVPFFSRIAIADSKALYQSGGGLRLLERGLMAALAQLGPMPASLCGLWQTLAPDALAAFQPSAGYDVQDRPLPLDADRADLDAAAAVLTGGLSAAGVRLVGLRSRVVFPEQFNNLLCRYNSKGSLLSNLTLTLVTDMTDTLAAGPIRVVCDKHGGRNCYGPLLAEHFPEWLVEVYGESRGQSLYRFGPTERRIEIRFSAKAESYLPVALASMASKYLRELAMGAWNEFWRARVPGLAPTAGYPQDAVRFKQAIAAVQAELGIDDQIVWRRK